MSTKCERYQTFEITGGKGFSFSNNFSASRNPIDPKDKNFTHFHLVKLVENLKVLEQYQLWTIIENIKWVYSDKIYILTWVCKVAPDSEGVDG